MHRISSVFIQLGFPYKDYDRTFIKEKKKILTATAASLITGNSGTLDPAKPIVNP